MTRPIRLEHSVIDDWLSRHDGWLLVEGHLVRDVLTTSHPSAASLVQSQIPLAQRLDHHAILTLGYRDLRVELWTHDCDGITQLDLVYAEAFDQLVTELPDFRAQD